MAMRWMTAGTMAGLAAMLSGCGDSSVPDDPRERLVGQCSALIAQAAQIELPPASVDATCGCMVDAMEAEGLGPADLFGEGQDRVQQIALDCARENGVPVG